MTFAEWANSHDFPRISSSPQTNLTKHTYVLTNCLLIIFIHWN